MGTRFVQKLPGCVVVSLTLPELKLLAAFTSDYGAVNGPLAYPFFDPETLQDDPEMLPTAERLHAVFEKAITSWTG